MANLKEEENLSPGQKLFISCKIGDYDNVQKILDEINELNDDERVRNAPTYGFL